MRTITTLVAIAMIVLAATADMQAQDQKRVRTSRWSIGPKAGLNLSHFWGSDFRDYREFMDDFQDADINPRLAGQFGGFFTWSNDGWFAVSGELLYSAKGMRTRFDNPFFGEDGVSVLRMDYIEMPILFRVFFIDEGAIRPHASFGPSWGVLVLSRSKILKPERGDAISTYDNMHKVDVGLNFGGGVNFRVGNNIWINPEVRYNLGLINVAENNATKNGTFSFAVGVGFPIGNQ